MKKVSILFLMILLLNSCTTTDKEKTVVVEDKYSISIPSFLTKASDLNSDASFQYQNTWKEFYVIVIDESRDDLGKALEMNDLSDYYQNDLNGYSSLLFDSLKEEINNSEQSVFEETSLNGLSAKLTTLTGRVGGVDIFYSIGYYESKDRYYQVLTWTTIKNKEVYRERMQKILYSLKEL